jgi:hypothetical protein
VVPGVCDDGLIFAVRSERGRHEIEPNKKKLGWTVSWASSIFDPGVIPVGIVFHKNVVAFVCYFSKVEKQTNKRNKNK